MTSSRVDTRQARVTLANLLKSVANSAEDTDNAHRLGVVSVLALPKCKGGPLSFWK